MTKSFPQAFTAIITKVDQAFHYFITIAAIASFQSEASAICNFVVVIGSQNQEFTITIKT